MSDFAVAGFLIVGILLSMVCLGLVHEVEDLQKEVFDLKIRIRLLELDNELYEKFILGDK